MNLKTFDSIKSATKEKNKRGFFVFLISLAIAFIFWLLFALSEPYTTTVTFNIDYSKFPSGKFLRIKPDEFVKVRVEAEGWDIINLKRSPEQFPVKIDLSNYIDKSEIDIGEAVKNVDFKQVKDLKVLYAYQGNFNLKFENLVSKSVPIVPNIKVSFQKNFGLVSDIKVNPSYLKIEGPKEIVDQIDSVSTTELVLEDIRHSEERIVDIEIPRFENLKTNVAKVELKVEVEEFTEGKLLLPIKLLNPTSDSMVLIPSYASIYFQTALSNYGKIDSSSIELFVNVKKINFKSYSKQPIKFVSKIDQLHSVRIEPQFVDYIIIGKP